MDTIVILLIFLLVLLFIQLFALFKVRYLIRRLKKLMNDLNKASVIPGFQSKYNKRKCQFCKYRKTYLNVDSEDVPFYYVCQLHKKVISLNDQCNKFKLDPYYYTKA